MLVAGPGRGAGLICAGRLRWLLHTRRQPAHPFGPVHRVPCPAETNRKSQGNCNPNKPPPPPSHCLQPWRRCRSRLKSRAGCPASSPLWSRPRLRWQQSVHSRRRSRAARSRQARLLGSGLGRVRAASALLFRVNHLGALLCCTQSCPKARLGTPALCRRPSVTFLSPRPAPW